MLEELELEWALSISIAGVFYGTTLPLVSVLLLAVTLITKHCKHPILAP